MRPVLLVNKHLRLAGGVLGAVDLAVRLVSYGGRDPGLERLAQEFV